MCEEERVCPVILMCSGLAADWRQIALAVAQTVWSVIPRCMYIL